MVATKTAIMKLINVVACVIIGWLYTASAVPYSEGNVDRSDQETEWLRHQNQKPLNEFGSQQFSVLNRNNGDFIPRNNYQNNAGSLPLNNILKNGYNGFISHENYPNFNSMNKFQSNIANQENYQNFERRDVNAQLNNAFIGQKFNQEAQVNKELTEINQLIARENLMKLEMERLEKLREANIQHNYRPNIMQRPQQPLQQQNYYNENNRFGSQQPTVQNQIRPEISVPITPQYNIPQQKILSQENPEETKKGFLVIYPNGVRERVYDLDAFIKSHQGVKIERRQSMPQQPKPLPQQQLQKPQNVLQKQPIPQILQQQVPLPVQQIPQKPLQQSISQRKIISTNTEQFSSTQQNNINPNTIPQTANTPTKLQPLIDTKVPVTKKNVDIKQRPTFSPINQNSMLLPATKNVPKSSVLKEQPTVPQIVAAKQDISRIPISNVAVGDKLKNLLKKVNQTQNIGSNARSVDNKLINLTNKTPVTTKPSPVKISQSITAKKEKKVRSKQTPSTIVSTQTTVTSQSTQQNEKAVVKQTITKKPLPNKKIKSKDDSRKKPLPVQKNINIPELVLKIEGESVQTKPTSQSEKITVSEEVISVQPTKQEVEIGIAKIIERDDGTEVKHPEKIFIPGIPHKIKQKKSKETKSKATVESLIVKKDLTQKHFNKPTKKESPIVKNESKKSTEEVPKKELKKSDGWFQNDKPWGKETKKQPHEETKKQPREEKPEEPECDDEPLQHDKIITREQKTTKVEHKPYKEEIIEETYYEYPKEEEEPEYVRELKNSLHREKLVHEELIENGEKKHHGKIKHENGITVFTSDASKGWVEEVNNAELTRLQKKLKNADSKEKDEHWLAKEAFVFKTSDATIPEFIKKASKHHKKPVFLFQFVFPPTVDREVTTTIHPDGTVTEEVKEYLCDSGQGESEDEANENEKIYLEVFKE